jgi:nicotinamide-nucleotide amidase
MNCSASIITIGDELLIGQVIDTNSAFIAQKLSEIGISVVKRIALAMIKIQLSKHLIIVCKILILC